MSVWSVVATVKAPKELIDIFVNHYINLGAEKIYLYLDDPKDSYIKDLYESNTKVDIELCTPEYWSIDYNFDNLKYAGRSDAVERRQEHNLVHAISKCTSKWILCVDIDELIYARRSINEILCEIPDNLFSLRLKPYEAIYLNEAPQTMDEVFSTKYFKHRNKRIDLTFWNKKYPKEYIHKNGLFGHITGKAFLRTDIPLKYPALHNPYPINAEMKSIFLVDEIKLLHYEALTVDFFIEKTLNRLNKVFYTPSLDKPSVDRLANLKELYDSKGRQGLESAYETMHVITSDVLSEAILLHLIDEIDINSNHHDDVQSFIYSSHRSVMVFDESLKKCILVNPIDIKSNQFVVKIGFDYDSEKCYLYFVKDKKTQFLFVDRFGYLVTYTTNQTMFFGFKSIDKIAIQFAIQFGEKFFTARPNGEVILAAVEPKAWEIFTLHYE